MKFIKSTKIITVKGTAKRVTHKRKIKVSDKTKISSINRIKKIIPNVNLNGATNDQLNSIADGVEESISKFPKIKINSISWITSDDEFNYGKIDAAYIPKSHNNPKSRIILNKDVISNIESWSKNADKKFNSRKEINIDYYKDHIDMWGKWDSPEQLKKMNVTEKDKMMVSDYAASKNTELWAETGSAIHGKINIPNSVKGAFKNTMEIIQ